MPIYPILIAIHNGLSITSLQTPCNIPESRVRAPSLIRIGWQAAPLAMILTRFEGYGGFRFGSQRAGR